MPNTLEIIVYSFIYSSCILGEIQNFYGIFSNWDTILHILNGFLCAAIGFSLVDILNNIDNTHMNLNPIFVVLVSMCFSMTVGVIWEFVEFTFDQYFEKDMQKDKIVMKVTSIKINNEKNNHPILLDDIQKTIIYAKNKKIVIEGGYLELGLIDTMKDLFVNFLGALCFSFFGYFYIKNKNIYTFAKHFLISQKINQ